MLKNSGNCLKCEVSANAADLTKGNKLYVLAVDKNGKQVLVNAKSYAVTKNGSVNVTLPSGMDYQLVTKAEKDAAVKAIKATIAPTAEESFYKLAVLDVKAGLYPTIKHYEGLDTPLGRIELKIDDWQNAAQDRKDLLQQWDEDYLLDAVDLMYQ